MKGLLLLLLLMATLLPICLGQYGMYGGYGGGYGGYGSGYGGYGYGGGFPGYGGYGMPFGGNPFMGYGSNPDLPPPLPPVSPPNPPESETRDCRGLPSMRSRSLCRYGGGLGNPMGIMGATGCMDTNPQCSVWASTGQCSTNALMMRQTCALSCGTCASGLGGLNGIGTSSIYNPFGTTGIDQYPLSQFIGRSIYETGLLNRQPNPSPTSRNIGIITKAKSVQLPTRR